MYPKEYFSHPRIASFCHRTKIWREADSLESLGRLLYRLLTQTERSRFETECKIFDGKVLPQMIDIYHPEYPSLLKEIYDPPLVLAYLGDLDLLRGPKVAIVGTRKASRISVLATKLLILALQDIDYEIRIVSGMALGIDRQAFISAMDSHLGVIGILGTSITEEYPPGNRDLYKRMKESPNTLLLSEFIFPTEPARWTFPKRNRLISGLVNDVYIMESGKKSGTLSTANSALSQNREIHVFDHELQNDNTGGLQLLSEGAEALLWDQIADGKGLLEYPDTERITKEHTYEEWKKGFEKEILSKISKKKTPLGRGVYWVPSI